MVARGRGHSEAAPARGARLARLILDTSVLVAAERRRHPIGDVVERGDDVAIAAVTAAELLLGVELANAARREQRHASVEQLLARVRVEDYDLGVARAHAVLLAHTRRTGRARPVALGRAA